MAGRDDRDDRDDKCRVPRVRARVPVLWGEKTREGVLARRLKLSSLSSLSSLKGVQGIEVKGKEKAQSAEKNVPFGGVIVPIVPVFSSGNQYQA